MITMSGKICFVSVTRSHSLFFVLLSLLPDAGHQPGGEMFYIVKCLNCCNIKADRGLYIDIDTAVPVDRMAVGDLIFPDDL